MVTLECGRRDNVIFYRVWLTSQILLNIQKDPLNRFKYSNINDIYCKYSNILILNHVNLYNE